MSEIELSLITVNYGSSNKIKALIDSIKKAQPNITWEWIIVDNFSSKDEQKSLGAILKDEPNCHLICLKQNTGYGQGNAEGARFCQGKYLGIINPDIKINPGCLEQLITSLETEKNAGICVPVLKSHDGRVLKNTRRFPTPWKIIKRRVFGFSPAKQPASVRSVEWAQGSFWVLKKSLFDEFEGFDDRFFLFFEDTDFCRRIRAKGLKTYQVPTAQAEHSPDRLSGGNVFSSLFRKTFWIHFISAVKYFWKWR